MNQPEHILLPLELLLDRLKGAGIPMDPARRLRLLRMLEHEAGSLIGDPDVFVKLKYLLTPFIARTPNEQEQVYAVFDKLEKEWREEAEKGLKKWEEGVTGSDVKAAPKPFRMTWLRWGLTALGLILILLIGYKWWVDEGKVRAPKVFFLEDYSKEIFREGNSLGYRPIISVLTIFGTSNLPNSTPGLPDQYLWQIINSQTGQVEHSDTTMTINWVASKHGDDKKIVYIASNEAGSDTATTTIHIHCADPPAIQATYPSEPFIAGDAQKFEVKLPQNAEAEWIFDGTDTVRGDRVTRTYADSSGSSATVRLNVWRKGYKDDCYNTEEKTFSIGSNKPYLAEFPLQKDEPKYVLQLNSFVWSFILIPLFLGLFFFTLWWEEYTRSEPVKQLADLEEDFPIQHAAPYYIPYLPQEGKISVPRDFFRVAEILNRREAGWRRQFDVDATLKATVDAGGFPSLRETPQTRPTEYLFLVTRPNERDQLGRLFERLCAFLKRRDVPMENWFHDGRFERFWNKDNPDGTTLVELNRRFPYHRLVLLGDGHKLVDSEASDRPRLRKDLATTLARWPRRLLFTPEPVSGWQFQEKLLHKLFLIFPADTDGILEGFDLLDRTEEYDPGNYERWENRLLITHPEPTHRYRKWETVEEHFAYLDTADSARDRSQSGGKSLKHWFCALAVSPQPDWALTIAIGRAIGAEVTHDRLLALTRIPWLSANKPDTALRLQLLGRLGPEDEAAAREAFAAELEAVREQTQQGFAETERRTHLAVQRFALDPFDPEHRRMIGDLKKVGLLSASQQEELKFIYETKVVPVINRAESDVFEWIERPEPKSVWNGHLFLAFLAMAFAAAYYFTCRMVDQEKSTLPVTTVSETEKRWFNSEILDDNALKLNNEASDTWNQYSNAIPYDTTNRTDYPAAVNKTNLKAKSLLDSAIEMRNGRYSIAEENLLKLQYNNLAILFNLSLVGEQGIDLNDLRQRFESLSGNSSEKGKGAVSRIDTSVTRRLAALHGAGLCSYYLQDYNAALQTYNTLLQRTDSLYFDTLRAHMPVNLQTLLQKQGLIGRIPYWINVVALESPSGKPVPRVQIRLENGETLRTDAGGRAGRQFMLSAAPARVRASVRNADFKPWSGSLRYNSTASEVDTIRFYLVDKPAPYIEKDTTQVPEVKTEKAIVLLAYTINALTKDTISDVVYQFYELGSNYITTFIDINKSGFNENLNVDKRYRVIARKEGFLSDSIDFSTVNLPNLTNPIRIVRELRIRPIPTEENYMPIILFFEYDKPDAASLKSSTSLEYRATYADYMRKKDEYMAGYTKGLSKEAAGMATDSIDAFFENDLRGGWNRLMAFSEVLYDMLSRGDNIQLTLKGHSSTLKGNSYDINLTERRISSIYNHFSIFDGGIYEKFVKSGQLTFVSLNDNNNDKGSQKMIKKPGNYIYSPQLCKENWVQILGVTKVQKK